MRVDFPDPAFPVIQYVLELFDSHPRKLLHVIPVLSLQGSWKIHSKVSLKALGMWLCRTSMSEYCNLSSKRLATVPLTSEFLQVGKKACQSIESFSILCTNPLLLRSTALRRFVFHWPSCLLWLASQSGKDCASSQLLRSIPPCLTICCL